MQIVIDENKILEPVVGLWRDVILETAEGLEYIRAQGARGCLDGLRHEHMLGEREGVPEDGQEEGSRRECWRCPGRQDDESAEQPSAVGLGNSSLGS